MSQLKLAIEYSLVTGSKWRRKCRLIELLFLEKFKQTNNAEETKSELFFSTKAATKKDKPSRSRSASKSTCSSLVPANRTLKQDPTT